MDRKNCIRLACGHEAMNFLFILVLHPSMSSFLLDFNLSTTHGHPFTEIIYVLDLFVQPILILCEAYTGGHKFLEIGQMK